MTSSEKTRRPVVAAILWAMAVVMGCGTSSTGSSTGATGGTSTGATGGGGSSTSSTGGTGGSSTSTGAPFKGKACGSGAPCSKDGKCSYGVNIDWVESCNCDPSGHFFCSIGGGAAPPSCDPQSACGQGGAGSGSCSTDNGFCKSTCTCNGSCMYTCDGQGPAMGDPIVPCDDTFCKDHLNAGGCTMDDGTCKYSVMCSGNDATVDGTCPNP